MDTGTFIALLIFAGVIYLIIRSRKKSKRGGGQRYTDDGSDRPGTHEK